MSKILIKNAAFRVDVERADGLSLLINDEVIEAISDGREHYPGDTIELTGSKLFPGFIDVHNHGAVGVDVNAANADGLVEVGRFLARNGVTAWVPTLVPDSDENYRRVIAEIEKVMAFQDGMAIAQIVGVHYEGVFANEKMCGALRPEFFKKFTSNEVRELPQLSRGAHMTTFAPEIDGGVELVRELVRRGWIPSIGHTRADVGTLDAAFAAGARHCTHFFNAMTGIHHRDVGVAGWALANGEVTFDIIADGIHVHPKMLELACRAKTADSVSLISDSVAPTGRGDGNFELWGETIRVENRRTKNERGSIAGSVITVLDAVRMMRSLGFNDAEVSKMASLNPAKLLGIDDRYGSVEVGKRADLVALDENGGVAWVMVGGKLV
jgi:N-acetylglucosamine-6-phosphate deacetylase